MGQTGEFAASLLIVRQAASRIKSLSRCCNKKGSSIGESFLHHEGTVPKNDTPAQPYAG